MAGVVTWCPVLLLLLLLTHPAAPSPQRPRGEARRLTCPKSCEDSFRPVCGSNNKVYRNLCHLHLASCQPGSSITKVTDGPCVRPAGNRRPGPELAPAPSPCKEECTKIYTPICASDGNFYNNLCIMEFESCKRQQVNRNAQHIIVVHEGLCDTVLSPRPRQCGRRCGNSYEPVCGSDGQTYYNDCELSVANCLDDQIRQRYVGVCAVSSSSSSGTRSTGLRPSLVQSTAATGPQASVVAACQEPCTGGFRPVCGNNGITYGSDCLLKNARCVNPTVEKRADGVCSKDCSLVCPNYTEYVCGNNNISYQNDCFLVIDQCKDASIRKISEGRCTSTSVIRDVCTRKCSITYDPVCGSDGATYTNTCTLGAATCHHGGLVKLYDGECKR